MLSQTYQYICLHIQSLRSHLSKSHWMLQRGIIRVSVLMSGQLRVWMQDLPLKGRFEKSSFAFWPKIFVSSFGARCLRIYKNDDPTHIPSKCSKACGIRRARRGPQDIAASLQLARSSKCSFLWRSSMPTLSKCLPAGDIETDSSLESAILATKSFPLRATREWATPLIIWRLSGICHSRLPWDEFECNRLDHHYR